MININTKRKCSGCGGICSLATCNCEYCGTPNEELKTEIDKVTTEIKQMSFENMTEENVDYVIFMCAHEDEILEIDSLKNIYINNDLKNKFDDMMSKINKKSASEYTDLDKEFFSENILNNPKFQYDPNFVLRQILLGNKIVSKDAFKESVRVDITNSIRMLYPYLKSNSMAICEFKDIEDCEGLYNLSKKNIYINNKTVDLLYELGSVSSIQTIFHELYHSLQHFRIDNFDIAPNAMHETMYDTKEFLLIRNLNNYYKDNYDVLKTEKDANISGVEGLMLILERLGLNLDENTLKYIDELKKQEIEKRNINIRKYNNEEINFYDLFDKTIVSHPEWLEKYPQLNIEYILDNDTIRRKTKEEIGSYLLDNLHIDEKYISYLIDRCTVESETMKI